MDPLITYSPELVTVWPVDVGTENPALFWADDPSPELCNSISRLGQLSPIILDDTGSRPILLSGVKRLRVLTQLNRFATAVRLESNINNAFLPQGLLRGLIYLACNFNRQRTEAMLVQAGRYFQTQASFEVWMREAAPYLGLSAKSAQAARLEQWLELPSRFDSYLFANRLTLASASVLSTLSEFDLEILEPFFASLKWSRNNLAGFVGNIREASLMQKKPVAELVEKANLHAVLHLGLSPNDTLHRLGTAARNMRYPCLTDMEERFFTLASEITRQNVWRVKPSQGFETDRVRLEVEVANRQELGQAVRDLDEATEKKEWDELWLVGAPDSNSGCGSR
ncbi:hypothetical protein [Desulfovibrio inopinatus]|uniref:hypothetical protein n=1 Tax=Desulfovibrio inopinatus TaxID=102109 RepID=UPI000403E033|nr:hypothetical protein [Desulfovibrio inopinatus]